MGDVASTDSGGNGFIDPGDKVSFTLPLINYVTAANAQTYSGVAGTLTTTTPGVSIVSGSAQVKCP